MSSMMQPPPPTPPTPPVPPEPPAPPAFQGVPGITIDGPGGAITLVPPPAVPRTAADMAALRARRSELSRQLSSASDRRDETARELLRASGPTRTGLEQRLQVLDQRIVQLERDIAENGRMLAAAPAGLFTATEPARVMGPMRINRQMELTPIVIVFILFVLAPMAIALARSIWKRGSLPPRQPALSSEDSQRLARLEQAVEAIAIEVERVSEGQRFVTNLLAESRGQPALAATHAADPVRLGR
jgi:hypothetical protein